MAIKVFAAEPAEDATAVARFQREAAVLKALRHPNILRLEDWGQIDGYRYIVTELAACSIAERLPLELPTAVAAVRAVCDALAFAHEHGIVHRDVKPQNVLVALDGTIRLGDFGTARRLTPETQRITETGDVVGTPYYMAPEVMHGAPSDPRMDVYAVGVLLYHLITQTLPIGYFEPLPGPLDPVVRRALAHSPERRYPTITALRDDLSAAARQIAAPPGASGPRGRSRSLLGAGATAAVVIGLPLAIASLWNAHDGPAAVRAAPPLRDGTHSPSVADTAAPGVPTRIELATVEPEPGPAGPRPSPSPQKSKTRSIRASEPRPSEHHDSRARASDKPGVHGTIVVVARPWAEVSIDGVPRGRAEPTARFGVGPGAHTVVLSHPVTNVRVTRRIEIGDDAPIEIRADLGRSPTP